MGTKSIETVGSPSTKSIAPPPKKKKKVPVIEDVSDPKLEMCASNEKVLGFVL